PDAGGAGRHDWPTFAGGPDRAGRVAGRLPYHWPARPTWTAPPVSERGGVESPSLRRPPVGPPVLLDGKVDVSRGRPVPGFDRRTGAPPGGRLRAAGPHDPCCTLSAANGRLFARIGPVAIGAPDSGRPGGKGEESVIACFAPAADSGAIGSPVRDAWKVGP